MAKNYMPGDPILLGLQADEDQSIRQTGFMAGGCNFDPPRKNTGIKKPG